MKAVLISVQPKWCELIASGKKTVEVRKTKPKIETPFKCYIYCTMGGDRLLRKVNKPNEVNIDLSQNSTIHELNGKVIGEFVCDKIVQFENSLYDEALTETVARSCVPMYDILVYLGKQDYGYGWHITDLVVYDEPRELSEFVKPCNHENDCCTCDRYDYIGYGCYSDITRPPQSWCYVEERSKSDE